jgi:hypothetical protein
MAWRHYATTDDAPNWTARVTAEVMECGGDSTASTLGTTEELPWCVMKYPLSSALGNAGTLTLSTQPRGMRCCASGFSAALTSGAINAAAVLHINSNETHTTTTPRLSGLQRAQPPAASDGGTRDEASKPRHGARLWFPTFRCRA